MSVELRTKCRTCMKGSSKYYRLYDYLAGRYKILEMLDVIVPQMLIKTANPSLSTVLCQLCVDKLLIAYKFQQLCIDTNHYLHNLMANGSKAVEADFETVNICDPLLEENESTLQEDLVYEQIFESITNTDEMSEKWDIHIERRGDSEVDDSDDTDSSIHKCIERTSGNLKHNNSSKTNQNGSIQDNKWPFSCNICKFSFATEDLFKEHKLSHKKTNQLKKSVNLSSPPKSPIIFKKTCKQRSQVKSKSQSNAKKEVPESQLPSTEEKKVRRQQNTSIEKFPHTPQIYREKILDFEDDTQWNNDEDDSSEQYDEDNSDHYSSTSDEGEEEQEEYDQSIQRNPTKRKRSEHYSKITKEDKMRVIELYEEGRKVRNVAELTSINLSTAKTIIRKYKKNGRVLVVAKRGGKRPKKLTPEILEWIEMFFKSNSKISIKDIKRKLLEEKSITVSLSTLYTELRDLKPSSE